MLHRGSADYSTICPWHSGARTYSHLEEQFVDYQANDVSGAHVLSHLEVRNTNRTPCTEATDSQVCEYARIWNAKSIVIRRRMFYVRIVFHTSKICLLLFFIIKRCYQSASDLITFGNDFEIKNPELILSRVCETVLRFRQIASWLNIPETWMERICDSLDKAFPEGKSLVSYP